MLIYPYTFLALMEIASSSHPVLRLLGMMLIFYGYYYIRAGLSKKDMSSFFKWTLHTRCIAILFLAVFMALGYFNWLVLIFGALDLTGAAITYLLMKKEKILAK